jgi:tetratricopeptide (TPR) repeat protein
VSYLGRLAAHPQINQLPTAAKFLQQALSIARSVHNTRGIRIELTRYIDVLIALGQYDKAEPLLDESEWLNQAANDQIGIAWNYKHRGQFQQRVDARQGDELIRQGRQMLSRLGIADDEWRPEFDAALKSDREG